jgi:cytochrome c2
MSPIGNLHFVLVSASARRAEFNMAAFILLTFASLPSVLAQSGDVSRGQRNFRVCAPCHSLEPDRNMTGPSLANLWERKSGGLSSFERYSDALKSSGIIWDDRTLDGWLTDPQRMVPDNDMPSKASRTTAFVQTCWPSSKRPPSRERGRNKRRNREA